MTDKNLIWQPEEIVELAKQAGFADGVASVIGLWGFHEFARIVAATEREVCAKLCELAEPYQAADLIRKRGKA